MAVLVTDKDGKERKIPEAREVGEQIVLKVGEETTRATGVEKDLYKAILEEEDRATSAEAFLETTILEEKNRAIEAENSLSESLASEVSRAKGAEAGILAELGDEISRAQSAEASLDGKINKEVADREKAVSALEASLQLEISRAKSAEGALSTSIQEETNRAIQAELQASNRLTEIESKIPNQASATNQLADKDFVNSSINSTVAFFRGNFETKAALDSWQVQNPTVATNNDYAYISSDETHGGEAWRYIYVKPEGQAGSWQPQFRVNEAPFTAEQVAAINSTITKEKVEEIAKKVSKSAEPDTLYGVDEGGQQVMVPQSRFRYAEATPQKSGLMSAPDKTKLDSIEYGAQVNTVTGVKGAQEDNYRTGNISLSPSDVGAEPAFGKNTAFNKNFGTESGTVCEGDDGRLENNVKYTTQSLSEEQKKQARTNIGALDSAELDISYQDFTCDHEFEITGQTGNEAHRAILNDSQMLITKIQGQTGRLSPNLFKGTSSGTSSGAGTASYTELANLIDGQQYTIQIYSSVSYSTDLRNSSGGIIQTIYTGGAGLAIATFTKQSGEYLNIYLNEAGSWWAMLVEGTYTADTMPAYQPYNNTLVNSKVKNVLSTGKNLYSGKNDLDWTPGYLENKYPLYLDKGIYSICVYAENPSGVDQYQFQGLDEYGNEVYSTPEVFVNTGFLMEVTVPISKILLYVNTTGHIKVMLNYGTSVLPYEPYISDDTFGVDLEITEFGEIDNISKQYTEYGSANVITLNGSENWVRIQTVSSDHWRFEIQGVLSDANGSAADVLNNSNWIDVTANDTWGGITGLSVGGNTIQICNEAYSTVEDFKAWLAANPIQFIYRLDTPRIQTTVDINSGYNVWVDGLQQQVIKGDYLPYILYKRAAISIKDQLDSLREINRDQYEKIEALKSHTADLDKYLPKSGGTMSGDMNMQSHDIIFQGDDPGDVIFKNANGDEIARVFYDAGTSKLVIRANSDGVIGGGDILLEGNINTSGQLKEAGQRVYSPNNPPDIPLRLFQYKLTVNGIAGGNIWVTIGGNADTIQELWNIVFSKTGDIAAYGYLDGSNTMLIRAIQRNGQKIFVISLFPMNLSSSAAPTEMSYPIEGDFAEIFLTGKVTLN